VPSLRCKFWCLWAWHRASWANTSFSYFLDIFPVLFLSFVLRYSSYRNYLIILSLSSWCFGPDLLNEDFLLQRSTIVIAVLTISIHVSVVHSYCYIAPGCYDPATKTTYKDKSQWTMRPSCTTCTCHKNWRSCCTWVWNQRRLKHKRLRCLFLFCPGVFEHLPFTRSLHDLERRLNLGHGRSKRTAGVGGEPRPLPVGPHNWYWVKTFSLFMCLPPFFP